MIFNVKSYGSHCPIKLKNKIAENLEFPHELVIPGIPARRAPWPGEKEESASHHFKTSVCFAQLRAEISENDAQRPPESVGNQEISEFW